MAQTAARVSAFLREVILRRSAIVFAATAVVHLVAVYGLLPDTAGPVIVDRLGQTIDVLGILVALVYSRAGTTPASLDLEPRSSDGVPLVPATGVA